MRIFLLFEKSNPLFISIGKKLNENQGCFLRFKICVLYSGACHQHIWRMQNEIYLSEVLTEMAKLDQHKNPIPFSISVRTYNQQNKSGGKLVTYENAMLMQPPKVKGAVRLSQNIDFKNPNHFANRTRNLKTNQGIKKIHILFITKFNGREVVL